MDLEVRKDMLAKLEELGDRLLALVVPQASASAAKFCCYWDGAYDRTRDWYCCNMVGGTAPGRCDFRQVSSGNPYPC